MKNFEAIFDRVPKTFGIEVAVVPLLCLLLNDSIKDCICVKGGSRILGTQLCYGEILSDLISRVLYNGITWCIVRVVLKPQLVIGLV